MLPFYITLFSFPSFTQLLAFVVFGDAQNKLVRFHFRSRNDLTLLNPALNLFELYAGGCFFFRTL